MDRDQLVVHRALLAAHRAGAVRIPAGTLCRAGTRRAARTSLATWHKRGSDGGGEFVLGGFGSRLRGDCGVAVSSRFRGRRRRNLTWARERRDRARPGIALVLRMSLFALPSHVFDLAHPGSGARIQHNRKWPMPRLRPAAKGSSAHGRRTDLRPAT